MSYRGWGRGRGRGYGRGPPAKELPFELFPEIEGLGKAEYSTANIQLIKWSSNLQKYWNSSPYFYEDRSQRTEIYHNPLMSNPKFYKIDAGNLQNSKMDLFEKLEQKYEGQEGKEKKEKENENEEENNEEEDEEEEGEYSDDGDYGQGEDFDDDEDDYNMADDDNGMGPYY
ncbi:hypothetical protein ACJIZ3_014407 [Penstemon smallii]|uniref:DNA-directed RNA polymerase III subunit n=1 Tax=Penstemon smallii TaxID=265156 RepID=A0ABD3RJK3_9LAMI